MMKLKNLIHRTIVFFLLSTTVVALEAKSQWWNPLAPQNFDDCVLQNLKQGMGEDAVRALRQSCYNKFPQATAQDTKQEREKKDRYLKCSLDEKHSKNWIFFEADHKKDFRRTKEILNQLRERSYDSAKNTVSFQNMNDFGISMVQVGFTKSKQCPETAKDYAYTTFCGGGSTRWGVGVVSFGSLSCGQLPKAAKSMGYCFIGYSPIYDQFDDSLLEFNERNGYCK